MAFSSEQDAGVDAPAAMAAMGPDGRPGRRRSLSGILRSKPDPLISPLPVWGSLLMGAVGIALLIIGLRDYKKYRTVIIIGGLLLAGAIVFWLTLFALSVIFRGGRSRTARPNGEPRWKSSLPSPRSRGATTERNRSSD